MEDCQIIDLYWNRSEAAITETSRKFGGFCRSIAMHILDNAEDAEECINDAFLAAWNTIPPQRPKKLSAFLGRITRNIALDRYDYNTAQKRNRQFHCILDELEECLAAGLDTEAEYESQQIAQVIRLFLEGCNTENRNIFLRRYFYADSIEEIAKRFAYSESKIKSLLFRMRKQLKKVLEKEGILL